MAATILIVDDSRFLQRHLEQVLERGGVCDRILLAAAGGEAIEVLSREDEDRKNPAADLLRSRRQR